MEQSLNMNVRYGDTIRLFTRSHYALELEMLKSNKRSQQNLGGFIGSYVKNGRHGVLSCIPPLGKGLDSMFREEQYKVLDPYNRYDHGKPVHYGHTVVLVNQYNLVWNNKTGGITGYIGPRPRNIPGEMYVSFQKNFKGGSFEDHSMNSINVTRTDTSVTIETNSNHKRSLERRSQEVIQYGDTDIFIEVEESNRHLTHFNKRLTNFKKPTSRTIGGYICSDGKGFDLWFTVFPIEPTISKVMIGNNSSGVRYGDTIQLEEDSKDAILVEFSSTGKLEIDPHQDIWKIVNSYSVEDSNVIKNTAKGIVRRDVSSKDLTTYTMFMALADAPGGLILKVQQEKYLTPCPSSIQASPASTGNISKSVLKIVSPQSLSTWVLLSAILLALLSSLEILTDDKILILAVLLWSPAAAIIVYGTGDTNSDLHMDYVNSHSSMNSSKSCTTMVLCKWVLDGSCIRRGNPIDNSRIDTSAPSTQKSSVDDMNMAISPTSSVASESPKSPPMPIRFLRATKGNVIQAQERWKKTLEWRREECMDEILVERQPYFKLIKQYYPHYYHKRGKNNEPVYYEKPGLIKLKPLKDGGVTMDNLLRHYAFLTEFLWERIEPSEEGKSITVLDLQGIGMRDVFGEALEFVRKASAFVGSHYPERAKAIYILNVPSWFNMIWNAVQGFVDEVTKKKIHVVKGKSEILNALLETISIDNIPEEYGGKSVGRGPEEQMLFDLVAFNNGEGPDPYKSTSNTPSEDSTVNDEENSETKS